MTPKTIGQRVASRWLKNAQQTMETRSYELRGPPDTLDRFEMFLAMLHYNGGHSGHFGISFDGDGHDRVTVKPPPPEKYRKGVGAISGSGADLEIAYEEGYGGIFEDRDRLGYFTDGEGNLFKENPGGEPVKLAAQVGTDTASIFAISPEQLYTIIKDGGWFDIAKHVYGDETGEVAPEYLGDLENIIRRHGGAVFNTGADGAWEVTVKTGDQVVEGKGFMPPYGVPQKVADRWMLRKARMAMETTLGPGAETKSWQGDFPLTVPCSDPTCPGTAELAFTASEFDNEGEPYVCDLQRQTGQAGGLWLHDAAAVAVYFCRECLEVTARYNQG